MGLLVVIDNRSWEKEDNKQVVGLHLLMPSPPYPFFYNNIKDAVTTSSLVAHAFIYNLTTTYVTQSEKNTWGIISPTIEYSESSRTIQRKWYKSDGGRKEENWLQGNLKNM